MKKIIAIVILFITISLALIGNIYNIILIRKIKVETELFKQQLLGNKEKRKLDLDICLDDSVVYYENQINNYCNGYEIKENCKIPQIMVKGWLENQRLLRDECFKKYPQN